MKKIILSTALVAAMMCFGNVYAAKPVKKAVKTEQATAKKACTKCGKKNCTCAKKAGKTTTKAAKTATKK